MHIKTTLKNTRGYILPALQSLVSYMSILKLRIQYINS